MEDFSLLILGAIVVAVFLFVFVYGQLSAGVTPAPDDSAKETVEEKPLDLVALADKIEPLMDKLPHPTDILANADFEKAVDVLASDAHTLQQCTNYALGSNWVLSCIGFEALSRRDDSTAVVERALNIVDSAYAWPLYFLVRFVDARSPDPVAARIVSNAQSWWSNNPQLIEGIGEFLERRLAAGEVVEFGGLFTELEAGEKESVWRFINTLPKPVGEELNACLMRHEDRAIDRKFLLSVGEILTKEQLDDPVFDNRQISRLRDELREELDSSSPRSVLIVGPSGVGKSALRRAFAGDLLGLGWHVFQTSAPNIIADKIYIGQIEGQIRQLAQNASVAKRVALYVDRMSELSEFGRSKSNDNSVLDQLWSKIESRKVFLVSETTPKGLQSLIRKYPALPTAMKIVHMQAVDEAEAGRMAEDLLDYLYDGAPPERRAEVVSETLQLAQQYLSHKSLPGSVLTLLELAVLRARRDGEESELQRDHVLAALSQVSGLPKDVLDDRQTLDIEALKATFQRSVIGQDEAVNCLVERIAMLKAGLTDPSRPLGVFLFAGPTGTGKTEIAKTLANVLFGSPEQMIRLDMSEYQDADSVWRILGQNNREVSSGSLVSRIREQPFAVVLLDEFEKAHAKVWDVFLQVFDDGRLSDTHGQAADFRHAIIILTSNLGAKISNEAGIGFTSTSGGFFSSDVKRTVNRTFRREFVNRLDRVVVFSPLSRDVMRAILHKELEKALGRRGLRTKQWAVEWEDSAIEFLLSEGFTPDLGARPLRRAIEQHLLAPLSMTMVQNRAPDGEQFLFVRSNGEALQVEFIDPDADPVTERQSDLAQETSTVGGLTELILSIRSESGAASLLQTEMNSVAERVESDEWAERKSAYLADLNRDGFWDRKDRFAVLDRIELIDRLDSAATVLGSLSDRLRQHPTNTKLIKSIANRLYVLQEGLKDLDLERPTQAYLGIRLVTADVDLEGAGDYLRSLVDMYRNWARARGMRLNEVDASASRYRAMFVVSGFGSHGVLEPESGLHVFEVPAGKSRFDRIRARVQVAPVPVAPAGKHVDRGTTVTRALDEAAPQKVEIIRRWRKLPSPLVRDSVRGWRTGRLDNVLAGNFDILR